MTYAMITGCSHTAGQGIGKEDCYVSRLEKHLGFAVINHGVSGGGCLDVLNKIVQVLQTVKLPKFIVAQWPNVFRKPCWINGRRQLQNINACEQSFKILLQHGEENFYEPWMQSIVVANLLCKLAEVPLINISFDQVDQEHVDKLRQQQIQLHIDEKQPGRTWLFDNGAQDNLHHSAQCHQQWTQRLIGIIDEHTT